MLNITLTVVERMYLKYKVTADDVTRLTKKKTFNADENTVAENIELEESTNTQEENTTIQFKKLVLLY